MSHQPKQKTAPPGFLRAHPDIWFLIRATTVVVLLNLVLDSGLGSLLLTIFLLFIPFALLVFAIHHWRMSDNLGLFPALCQFAWKHLDLIGLPRVSNRETYRNSAWVTYTLILLNEIIFYLNSLPGYWPLVKNHLIFLPRDPTWWNVPLSAVTSIFLHADAGHLWGNMLFLWAVGTTVERRLGWRLFLFGYLFSGLFANLLALDIYYYLMAEELHGLGASGAIAGVMGLFAVRCYFKEMIFPIPFFGILPIAYKMRVNALTVIGLFFAKDLIAGVNQVDGSVWWDNVNHWAHLGGMFAGALVAAARRVEKDAAFERSKEIALSVLSSNALSSAAFDRGLGIEEAERRTRELLRLKPSDPTLQLHLARLISRFDRPPEGRELYGQVLRQLVNKDPAQAVTIFLEFYEKYFDIADPATQFRLAALLQERGHIYHAAVTLELVARRTDAPEILRAKALFRSAELHAVQGLEEASQGLFREVAELFPGSELAARVRQSLPALN